MRPPLADARMNARAAALEKYLERKRRHDANAARKKAALERLREEREAGRERRNAPLSEKFGGPGLRERFGEADARLDRGRLEERRVKAPPVTPARGFSVPVSEARYYYNGRWYNGKGEVIG